MESPQSTPPTFDDIVAALPLEHIADACNVKIEQTIGKEVKIACPFGCPGQRNGETPISVNKEGAKLARCHAEMCDVRCNVAYLVYGWLNGKHPTNGRLRGGEFLEVRDFLQEVFERGTEPAIEKHREERNQPRRRLAKTNVPLSESGSAATRDLDDPPLTSKLKQDTKDMTSIGAEYVRSRPYLTRNMMEHWGLGQMPTGGGEDRRGKSLASHIVLPYRSADGHVLCYVGRDLKYEEKVAASERIDRTKERPAKHRYLPRSFNPGLELFGQNEGRLDDPMYRSLISHMGVLLVQDYMNVIALDHLGVPAFGICTDDVTDNQATKITHLAREYGSGQVKVYFDCDARGDRLAKQALWKLSCEQLDVQLVWSSAMADGRYAGQRPKLQSPEQWQSLTTRMRMYSDCTAVPADAMAASPLDEEMEAWQAFRSRLVEQGLRMLSSDPLIDEEMEGE